jgi:hypothetical protein
MTGKLQSSIIIVLFSICASLAFAIPGTKVRISAMVEDYDSKTVTVRVKNIVFHLPRSAVFEHITPQVGNDIKVEINRNEFLEKVELSQRKQPRLPANAK